MYVLFVLLIVCKISNVSDIVNSMLVLDTIVYDTNV